ncbi:hypothetical protein [Streptomyces chromofuscus]|uniref:Uncharacterized protein n=1 Tax=Streptomyces chromofuscus TaxID=42881 RepID=A0A7M2T7C5_STRCW|nr:hypothetical protein [Streptomyces chromofuscus]QOV44124.1 hypothetical protein IPT68_31460 [Streptomyces chromofuscus]GGT05495.1 hypothetical protein GCM10010254_27220 [Streptomyces chromofuscus]
METRATANHPAAAERAAVGTDRTALGQRLDGRVAEPAVDLPLVAVEQHDTVGAQQ